MSHHNLQPLVNEMLPAIQHEMRNILHADQHPPVDHLHPMMQYHMGWLDDNFEPITAKAGKHIRPLLCLLTCHAAGGNWQQALPAAAAVELLHNFSLIHDDIEDRSQLRRGRETLWRIWGVPLAINAGDALFAVAHLALNRLFERGVEAAVVVQILRRFDETCIQLTQGQHLDMRFESRTQVSVEEYLEMITGKTSVLLGLCAELGGLIAGATAEIVHHYAQFGLNLGLAFQVQDDILGIWGDETLIGKSAKSDIETRKKTLPVLYGLERSKTFAELFLGDEDTELDVAKVIEQLTQSGAQQLAKEQAATFSHKALHGLEAAAPQFPEALHELTLQLIKRQS